MHVKLAIWMFLAVSVICVLPNAAGAANGPYFAWGGFAPWTYMPPSVYVLERSPYFALHPPVYYSYPVSRPYGHLPYPYLPGPSTQPVAAERPQTIVNSYAAEPGDAGVPAKAALPGRVQVIYPAAVFDKSK